MTMPGGVFTRALRRTEGMLGVCGLDWRCVRGRSVPTREARWVRGLPGSEALHWVAPDRDEQDVAELLLGRGRTF